MTTAKLVGRHRAYFGTDAAFVAACGRANTPATHRQWRKWCQRRGLAWSRRNG